MVRLALILAALALAGCGADGDPVRPGPKEKPAVRVNGETQVGLSF